MKISLGFSPCPNDTFLFDALVHQKIDTKGLEFEVHLGDVEALNQMAFEGKLDVTKLSYHAFCYLTSTYQLLNAGSALGQNCGPLLIAKNEMTKEELAEGPIAIPGKYTTAHYLFKLAHPEISNVIEVLFSEIEKGVLNQEFIAGVIIHENRFTYQDKGLIKLMDLGENWETKSGQAIPLGGIVIKKNINLELKQTIDHLIAKSVQYAFEHPASSASYVKEHAQEMEASICQQHIDLYVNHFTEDLGVKGRAAVEHFMRKSVEIGLIPSYPENFILPKPQECP